MKSETRKLLVENFKKCVHIGKNVYCDNGFCYGCGACKRIIKKKASKTNSGGRNEPKSGKCG